MSRDTEDMRVMGFRSSEELAERQRANAASPQPAAQPEQPEPGALTDERIWRSDAIMAANAEAGLRMEVLGPLARAIEREVLSTTRKRTAEQNARIMKEVNEYGTLRWYDGAAGIPHIRGNALATLTEVERLLGGEA